MSDTENTNNGQFPANTVTQIPSVPPNTESAVAVNPLLARVEMPGSTFQMPSRGLFYNNDELRGDVEVGEVHVHPMSAYDEILLKTPDALFTGEAINKVFLRCIPQILKPMELLAKDVDYLLVCLRQVTFGAETEIKYTHDCKDAKSNSYMIDMSIFISNAKKIDPTTVGSIYSTTMDNGQKIKLRPARLKDVISMYQNMDTGDNTPEEELKMTVFVIKSVIDAVDGITDDSMIEEWIKKIPAGWVKKLTNAIEKTSDFGPSFIFDTKCKDCNEGIQIESPVNPISFFI